MKDVEITFKYTEGRDPSDKLYFGKGLVSTKWTVLYENGSPLTHGVNVVINLVEDPKDLAGRRKRGFQDLAGFVASHLEQGFTYEQAFAIKGVSND